MGFKDAISTCYSKYATFSGRASKLEFWWFTLLGIIVHMVQIPVQTLAMFIAAETSSVTVQFVLPIVIMISAIIVVYIPWMAVGCRRLHDIGWQGWPVVILFVLYLPLAIPFPLRLALIMGAGDSGSPFLLFFGTILVYGSSLTLPIAAILAYFLSRPSEPGPNKYGPPPPEVTT